MIAAANPWVDARVRKIRANAAMEYLQRHGWDRVPNPNENLQMFAGPQADSGRRITQPVPLLEQADDYASGIATLITNIAMLEDRPAVAVLEEMLGVTPPTMNGSANGQTAKELTGAA